MNTKRQWRGVGGCVLFLGWLGLAPSVALAEEELPSGLPDFPRRVRTESPDLRPGQEIKVGILKLHPSFKSSIQVDDNVRLADSDKDAAVTFTQKPGLIGEVKLGDHRLEAGYGMELLTFSGVRGESENATNHLAHGELELNFADMQFTVSDTMNKATSRLFSETSARDHVLINEIKTLGRYDRPMWALEGGWIHNTIDHRTDIFNNSDYGEDVLALLGGYKVSPKTLLLLETSVGLVNYDRNVSRPDHGYWQLFTGLRGELTPKITSTVKLGFQHRQFSDLSGESQKDSDGFVADTNLTYRPSESDAIRLAYLRTVRTSTFGTNNFYRQDKVSLSYRKRFFRKWLFNPKVGWQFNDYPEEGTAGGVTKRRDDHFAQVGVELRYDIQEWLSTGVEYHFRNRNSNLDTLDFDNNRFTCDVSIAF
jgi:hypothetical protein